jgi:hypothetical protein
MATYTIQYWLVEQVGNLPHGFLSQKEKGHYITQCPFRSGGVATPQNSTPIPLSGRLTQVLVQSAQVYQHSVLFRSS